jgi:hypothetical protein
MSAQTIHKIVSAEGSYHPISDRVCLETEEGTRKWNGTHGKIAHKPGNAHERSRCRIGRTISDQVGSRHIRER